MPTYDYVCSACGHEFELFQSMTAPVKRKCPQCGAAKLRRLVGTGAGILFKGGGFYETDYRSDSYKKAAQADQKAADGAKPAAADAAKPATDAAPKDQAKPAPAETKLNAKPKPARRKPRR